MTHCSHCTELQKRLDSAYLAKLELAEALLAVESQRNELAEALKTLVYFDARVPLTELDGKRMAARHIAERILRDVGVEV